MPTAPISMRKLKEIIRLKFSGGLTHRQIAKSLSVSPSVISTYTNRVAQMGITAWPLDDKWTDSELRRQFLTTKVKPKRHTLPNWHEVKIELSNKIVTLQLLWEDYIALNPAGYYSYNHYCRMYKKWLKLQKPAMRQTHKAGEKLFVDYCGPTATVVDRATGECMSAQVFVAVMGATNYTFAEATWSQKLEDWCMSHVRCFSYLGGVPNMVIPDNLRSAVQRAHLYEPDLNPTYQQLAAHYDTVVIPARPRKPKDKAKAEVGVQIVERWIMARLRKDVFYSLRELNARILELLYILNSKVMKQYEVSRTELFTRLDKPALKALPSHPYRYVRIKKVRAHIDYHVDVDKHYYSVPYSLVKQMLEAHISAELVTIYHQGEQVAVHPRSRQLGGHTTNEVHMPKAHQLQKWSPERFERWAKKIGVHTYHFIRQTLARKRYPEQSYRTCIGLLNLQKTYTSSRLDAACERALHIGVLKMKVVKDILDKGLDKHPLPKEKPDLLRHIQHGNIRGNDYYQ